MARIKDRVLGLSLKEVIQKDDDWTGMDSAARRKRQNRLNQRAYRRRKAQEHAIPPQLITFPCTWEYQPITVSTDTSIQFSSLSLVDTHTCPLPTRPPVIPYMANFTQTLSDLTTFPLTSDHLIKLVQFNVLRAALTNMWILSILQTPPEECRSAVAIELLPAPNTIPDSLKATPLQKSTPHEMWIDILPLDRWRDNMILMEGTYDDEDLCTDLVGGLFEGFNDRKFHLKLLFRLQGVGISNGSDGERKNVMFSGVEPVLMIMNVVEIRGILVWSDPWSTDGWEVTEGFLKKWGRLLRGCGELIESTNRWRRSRGEEPLVVEL